MKIKFPNWVGSQPELSRVFELGLTNLDPWIFYSENADYETRYNGLKERFPSVDLVPFARREDRDDIVCWEKGHGSEKVFLIHDYSSEGWEKRKQFSDFWDWFKQAVDDMIEHEQPYR